MVEEINDLVELFDDLTVEPTDDQLRQLRQQFYDDWERTPRYLHGKRIKVNLNRSAVRGFTGLPDTFVHLITRDSKIGKQRQFDPQRANRLHWVRVILSCTNDQRIWYYEHTNGDGTRKLYYWYEAERYVVILKPVEPDVLLVTGFCIDPHEERTHQKRHRAYRDEQAKKNRTP